MSAGRRRTGSCIEDIIRYFADVVVRQQECIDKMTQGHEASEGEPYRGCEAAMRKSSIWKKQEEMAAQGITPEEEEKFETVSEVVL